MQHLNQFCCFYWFEWNHTIFLVKSSIQNILNSTMFMLNEIPCLASKFFFAMSYVFTWLHLSQVSFQKVVLSFPRSNIPSFIYLCLIIIGRGVNLMLCQWTYILCLQSWTLRYLFYTWVVGTNNKKTKPNFPFL